MKKHVSLDGKLVRVIEDIYSCYGDGELIAESGTVFNGTTLLPIRTLMDH